VNGEVEDVIGTSEAAEMLGVSTREVRRKADAGTLPAWQEDGSAGAEWRFRRTDVEEYRRRREGGDERKAEERTEGTAVLPATAIIDAQDRATEAALTLAGRLGDLADLRDTLAANADAQEETTGAVRELVETLREQEAERARLADELSGARDDLAAARERIEELEAELAEERERSWWERLRGR
jgi:excisionase family DNA binding protein